MNLSHAEKRVKALSLARLDWLRMAAASLAYVAVTVPCLAVPGGVLFLRPGAGVVAAASLLFGPAVGFVSGFAGDLLASLWQGSVWLHWSLGTGLYGLVVGLLWLWSDIDTQRALRGRDLSKIAFFTASGAVIGVFAAGLVDVLLGASPELAFFTWMLPAACLQAVWGFAVGSLLLWLWQRGIWTRIRPTGHTRVRSAK